MPRRNIPVKPDNTNKIIVGGIIAAVVIVGGLIALNALASKPAPQPTSASRDWGSPNAPITLVEYSDFQ